MEIVAMILGTILFFMSFKFVRYFVSNLFAFIGLWFGWMVGVYMVLTSIFSSSPSPASQAPAMQESYSYHDSQPYMPAEQNTTASISSEETNYKRDLVELFSEFDKTKVFDTSDTAGMTATFENAKEILNKIIVLEPPESCKAGHERLSSSCDALIQYMDSALSILNETDLAKALAVDMEMSKDMQIVICDMDEGLAMLDSVLHFDNTDIYDNSHKEKCTMLFYKYIYGLNNAINTGDFTFLSSSVVTGSVSYEQKKLVQSLFDRGIKEHVISIEILDLNDGDPYFDNGFITSLEVIGVQYPDGTYKEITQSYRYYTSRAGGKWAICEMEECPQNVPQNEAVTKESMPYAARVISPDGIGVNLRSGPDSSYAKVRDAPIPVGSVIEIFEETTSVKGSLWGYTHYDGWDGWVYLAELEKIQD